MRSHDDEACDDRAQDGTKECSKEVPVHDQIKVNVPLGDEDVRHDTTNQVQKAFDELSCA